MQGSWRLDADKLTFILCLPLNAPTTQIIGGQHDRPQQLLGDINLFLTKSDDGRALGEIELMIAVKISQGQGYGRASLLTFLRYIVEHEAVILAEFRDADMEPDELPLEYLRVKVGETNLRSIALFESVGFQKVGDVNVFDEIELRMNGDWRATVVKAVETYGLEGYEELEYLSSMVSGGEGGNEALALMMEE